MRALLFDKLSQGLQNVLTLRQQQHALTATNLANSETPGFKAKVIDFEHALSGALEGATSGDDLAMLRTDPLHMSPIGVTRARIDELDPDPWSTDGNSVLPEREQARLQHNSLLYRATAQGMSRRFAMLKYAANDGR